MELRKSWRVGTAAACASDWYRRYPHYDNLQFTAYDDTGRAYVSTAAASREPLTAGSLAPGEGVHGFLTYRIPSDATVARVVWHKDVFEWVNEWVWQ